jgi:hypothetical protein
MRIPGKLPTMPRRSIWQTAVPLAASLAIFIFHFSVIAKNAVNIPYFDDWAAFSGADHPASIDWPWLLAQHNEHRMATTKLFIWAQFQVNGWNVRTHLLLAFLIYGILVALIAVCGRKWLGAAECGSAIWWFVPFFLSPLIWFNHFMAYTVSVHLWLLVFYTAAYLVFAEVQTWPRLLLGWAACILAIYSWAAGFVTGLVLLVVYCAFKGARIAARRDATRRELLQLIASIAIAGSALAGWLYRYQKPSHHPPLVWPYQAAFWSFFANLIAGGFGILRLSTLAGIVCLLIVLTPVAGLIYSARGKLTSGQWAIVAVVLSILTVQCSVTMGRAGFSIINSKIPEYAEIGLPLIMAAVISWILFLKDRPTLQRTAVALLWLMLFSTFFNKWGDFSIYQKQRESRAEGFSCVQAYYQHAGDGYCPTIAPTNTSIAPRLEQAKRLNASLYREASR